MGIPGFPVAVKKIVTPFSFQFVAGASSAAAASPKTVNVSNGTSAANNIVLQTIHFYGNASGRTISGVTIDGETATVLGVNSASAYQMFFAYAAVSSDGAADTVITADAGSPSFWRVNSYRLLNLQSTTHHNSNFITPVTSTAQQTVTLSAPANGVVIGAASGSNQGAFSWDDGTTSFSADDNTDSGIGTSCASRSITAADGTYTLRFTPAGNSVMQGGAISFA